MSQKSFIEQKSTAQLLHEKQYQVGDGLFATMNHKAAELIAYYATAHVPIVESALPISLHPTTIDNELKLKDVQAAKRRSIIALIGAVLGNVMDSCMQGTPKTVFAESFANCFDNYFRVLKSVKVPAPQQAIPPRKPKPTANVKQYVHPMQDNLPPDRDRVVPLPVSHPAVARNGAARAQALQGAP